MAEVKKLLRKRATWVAVGVVAALAVVVAVYLRGTRPKLRTLADELAQALQADPAAIQSNLPPADGRYPGAVLVRPAVGQVAALRLVDRPEEGDGVAKLIGDLSSVQTSAASGLLSGNLRGLRGGASSAADVEVTLRLKGVRVFEVPLGKALKDQLIADGDVVSAERRRLRPEVIFRSYEATPVMTVRQGAAASVEAWDDAKGRLLRAGATIAAGGSLQLVATRPVVVAYETVTVDFLSRNFSAGGIEDVRFTPQTADRTTLAFLDPATFGLRRSGRAVTYVAVGTAQYRSERFGNLESVGPSMELAGAALEQVGAAAVAGVQPPQSGATTRASMDAFLDQLAGKLAADKPAAFVFYYVGHAVARRGGHMYLVLSDYNGDLKQDLGEETMLGLPRAQLEAPNAPLGGSNIGSILDVVNAAEGELPDATPGLYAVAEVCQRIGRANVPFAVVVDGCFESETMEALRQELNLTRAGDYYGPKDLPAQELQLYASALRQFGVAPYLHAANPVVLSAKPGSVALEVPHPAFGWEFAPRVGPLAARMYRLAQASVVGDGDTSWGAYLRGLADYAGTGELGTKGSISWSDFEPLRQIPALERQP